MQPGRELDRVVAEKIFGIENLWNSSLMDDVPEYSTDIAAAWEVVHKLGDIPRCFGVNLQRAKEGYWCELSDQDLITYADCPISCECGDEVHVGNDGRVLSEHGETAPHAICLAALKAVGHDPVANPYPLALY